jgi:hypothetical protein
MIGPKVLTNLFTYHPPKNGQQIDYVAIRAAGLRMATLLDEVVPDGPDKDEAIRHLRAAVMWSNAAIACEPAP